MAHSLLYADDTMDKDIVLKNWQLIVNYIKTKYSGVFTKNVEICLEGCDIIFGVTPSGEVYIGCSSDEIFTGAGYTKRIKELAEIQKEDPLARRALSKLKENSNNNYLKFTIYEYIIRFWQDYKKILKREAYYCCDFNPNDAESI